MPELYPKLPGASNTMAALLSWDLSFSHTEWVREAKTDGKNSTPSFENGFKDAIEMQNINSSLFLSDSD